VCVDPNKPEEISAAIKGILTNEGKWREYSEAGIERVRERYTWERHAQDVVKKVGALRGKSPGDMNAPALRKGVGRRLAQTRQLFITDIDGTLLGDDEALAELSENLLRHRDKLAFGVASGRFPGLALEALEEAGVPEPDVVIGSVGTEICYGAKLAVDQGWSTHIGYRWQPGKIREVMAGLDWVSLQEDDAQRPYKISYYMKTDPDLLALVHRALADAGLRYHAVHSGGQFLDILPFRASKGKAVRYLDYKWSISLGQTVTAGDTGNDETMLRGEIKGIVVGNYGPELEQLRGLRRIYFAQAHHAAGILEGLRHYGVLSD
jgi:sucrose-phosphate synthase